MKYNPNYNKYTWKKDKLYLGEELVDLGITPDKKYPNMFRVVFEDGVESADFYNKTRAKDHCVCIATKRYWEQTEDTQLACVRNAFP